MVFRLLLLFTLLPALELLLLLHTAKYLGASWTVALIALTGIAGSILAKWQGLTVVRQAQEQLARGEMPSHGLLDGVMILLGGALLLTPGFVTDLAGLSCLVPWTRHLLKAQLRRLLERWVESGQLQVSFRDFQ